MDAKCSCQYCNGRIAFESSEAGRAVACPHCGLETKLFVPATPANKQPQNVGVEIKRGMNPLGVASLVLGIGACVFCWIPFLGLLAIPLAAIGLLLAVIGITVAIVGEKSSLSFPVGGAVICTVAILIALFVTGGISTLIAKHAAQSTSSNQQVPGAATTRNELSSGENNWSKSRMVQQGDLQIKVVGWSEFDRVLIDAPGEPGNVQYCEHLLTIRVALSNLSKTKKIDFTTWRGKNFHVGRDYATLTDNNGNVYKRIDFGFKGIKNSSWIDAKNETAIYPEDSFEDLLVFEPTVKNLNWLHLELPAENFGGSGMIRFEIPISNTEPRHTGDQLPLPPRYKGVSSKD